MCVGVHVCVCVCPVWQKSFPFLQRFVDSKQKSKQKVLALWGDFLGGGGPTEKQYFHANHGRVTVYELARDQNEGCQRLRLLGPGKERVLSGGDGGKMKQHC